MAEFPFKKIDAFATPTSAGNPAGAIYLESMEAIRENQMQRIARELGGFVSETGFIARIAADAFKVRYFSAEREVQFCGHATIAMLFDLFAHDATLAEVPRIRLHTNKGILTVENRVREEAAVHIQAPAPVYTASLPPAAEIARALNLPESALDPAGLGLVNAGNQTLCVPLKGLDEVLGARPDFAVLLDFCQRHQLDVVTLFSQEVADPANHLRTRVFAAPFGYLEDPATGSGNAALGYHLHRTGRWDGKPIRIEQNADRAHPNLVRLGSIPDPEHGIRTTFGGAAITRFAGQYFLS